MVPQGSTLTNKSYIAKLTDSVNACQDCSILQELADEGMASIGAMKAGIEKELAELMPVLSLLTPPSIDPTKIVTWITDFITHTLTPMTKPTSTYALQLAELMTQLQELSAAITSAASRLQSCSVNVSIP